MNVNHELISLSDGSTTLIPSPVSAEVFYSVSFSVQNVHDSAYVYIGSTDVNSGSYGIRLLPGAVVSFENLPKNAPIYAISDTNGSQISVLRMSM